MASEKNLCMNCSKKFTLFTKSSTCIICSKIYSDCNFCKECFIQVEETILAKILRQKYCYSCYLIIESSKESFKFTETNPEKLNSDPLMNIPNWLTVFFK